MNLRKYISKSKDEDEIKLEVAKKKLTLNYSPRAKLIARLFRQFYSELYGQRSRPLNTNASALTCFSKCARRIEEYEKQNNTKVDLARYIRAHFSIFGNKTFPAHLISENSWLHYAQYHEPKETQLSASSLFDAEARQLKYLADRRGEDEYSLLFNLKDSGLFTSNFVSTMLEDYGSEISVRNKMAEEASTPAHPKRRKAGQ